MKIEGDYAGWVQWLKIRLYSIKEYDSNGNLIHRKDSNGYEEWNEYDSNGNIIHQKDSDGYEWNYPIEYYPSSQIKRYDNMFLPEL